MVTLGDDKDRPSDRSQGTFPVSHGAQVSSPPASIDVVQFLDLALCPPDLTVEQDRMGPVHRYQDIVEVAFPAGTLPIEAFQHGPHRALVEVWNRLQQSDGGIPPRSAFDVMEILPSAAHLTLVQEIEDGADLHYRVQGGVIVSSHSREMTGKRMSDYRGGPALLHGPLYRRVIDERRPVYCEHSIPSPQQDTVQRWSRICVPLLGPADGAHFVLNSAVRVNLEVAGY